jgi:spore coat polysaccharide biosynthesis predicted glycosyltransferase SpsG
MTRNVFFRVDANSIIGRGHLSRCIAVKDMLAENFQVAFVCLEENKTYINELISNISIKYIKNDEEIFDFLKPNDFLWLDGYGFTEMYKKRLKSSVCRLIETNDIPYEAKNVDIIFNHTPGLKPSHFGKTTAELYLGLEFALLRRSFLQKARKNLRFDDNDDEGVFICFGGADTYDLGQKFVDYLIDQEFNSPIYWVTNKKTVFEKSMNSKNISILNNLSEDEMIDYMSKCRVLLIPSSVLSFEAMALRKPFFTCYFVDNQKLIFEGLKKSGLAECFGFLDDSQDIEIAAKKFLNFFSDQGRQKKIVESQMNYLKGNTQKKIVNILSSLN